MRCVGCSQNILCEDLYGAVVAFSGYLVRRFLYRIRCVRMALSEMV